jgi:hypothetical protein
MKLWATPCLPAQAILPMNNRQNPASGKWCVEIKSLEFHFAVDSSIQTFTDSEILIRIGVIQNHEKR